MQHLFFGENFWLFLLLGGVLFVLALFLVRYAKKFYKKSALLAEAIKKSKIPLFFILIELYFLYALDLFSFSTLLQGHLRSFFYVLILVTIAWALQRILFSAYVHVSDRARREHNGVLHTQSLFLYRAAIFLLFFLSVAFLFLLFPRIKSVGFGLIGGAGIVGIAAGIAAKPIFSNILSGFIIAFNKTIKIGDGLFIYDTYGKIEKIHLTHVVIQTWDWIRIVVPMSEFVEKPFQNADLAASDIMATLFLYCDYTLSVDLLREKCRELIEEHPLHNHKGWAVSVTDCKEQTMEVRVTASTKDAQDAFNLRCELREHLLKFLQTQSPTSLPLLRIKAQQ